MVRHKTTLNETLVPDDIITEYIELNTVDGIWDFNSTVADVLEYMIALSDGVVAIEEQRGPSRVKYQQTLSDRLAYYRGLAGTFDVKIHQGELERKDYPPTDASQYG